MVHKKMILMDTPRTYLQLLKFIPPYEKELHEFIEFKIAEFRDPYRFNSSEYAKLFEQRANYIKIWDLLKNCPLDLKWEDFRDMEGVSVSTLKALVREGFIKSRKPENHSL